MMYHGRTKSTSRLDSPRSAPLVLHLLRVLTQQYWSMLSHTAPAPVPFHTAFRLNVSGVVHYAIAFLGCAPLALWQTFMVRPVSSELPTGLPILLLTNGWVSYFINNRQKSKDNTLPFPSQLHLSPASLARLSEERPLLQVDPIITWSPPNPSGILWDCSLTALSASSSPGSFLPAGHYSLEQCHQREISVTMGLF